MNFQSFDLDYIEQLKRGDPAVEAHFASYFGDLLYLKLRARLRSRELIEDIRQETLMRVLDILRRKQGVEHPERFGAFVNSVCNNVLLEMCRVEGRHETLEEYPEPTDSRIDLDAPLVTSEMKDLVRRVLSELNRKDRELLRTYYLEDENKSEMCDRLHVDRDYLRVLLHRAKARFRKIYNREMAGPPAPK